MTTMEPKPISGFPGYTIYPDGRIHCIKRDKILAPVLPDHGGYIQVSLKSQTGKKFTRRLHRLLAEHFIPKKDGDGDVVDHIDHDRTNNSLPNLRWATPVENGQNTSAKKRDMYCVSKLPNRKGFQVSIPQPDAPPKYIGSAPTPEEAQKMRDNALKGILPKVSRLPTYCITARPQFGRFEVSIPVGPRESKYIGHGKTLEEAQHLRDKFLDERALDPSAWKPKLGGAGVIYS